MIKKLVCVSMAVVVWAAVAAKEGHPQAELVASVEFAPFSDVKAKIVDFGKTINQPMVSVMAVPALQNFLTENLGEFRADSPMKLLCYADVAAVRKALESLGTSLTPLSPPSSIPAQMAWQSSSRTIPRRRRRRTT